MTEPGPAREEIILDAARTRFAYYGYEKVTMDEIANDIGMSKASLYYYFPTKEALFKTVTAREQAEFARKAGQFMESDMCAADKLRHYLEHRLEYFRSFHNLAKLSMQSFSEIKPAFGTLFKDFLGWQEKTLRTILESGNSRGEFCVPEPGRIARMLLHALHGLQLRTHKHAPGGQIDEEQFTELRDEARLLIELMVAGFAAPAESTGKKERHHV